MRKLLIPILFLMALSSCISTTHVNYSDPNYLESNEFNAYNVEKETNEITITTNDTIGNIINHDDFYEPADYYDYSYSSRIRRFLRPMYYSNYYGGIYTDYYWYNNDPFYCGTSIYYGYNWHSPYYTYYNYSPYYNNFYTPYFYGNYYSYYGYNYYNHYLTNSYYNNPYNNNSYTTGHRGSLSTTVNRGIKANTIASHLNNNNSKNIRHKSDYYNKITTRDNSSIRTETGVSKNTFTNRNYQNRSTKRTNTSQDSSRERNTIKTNNRSNAYSSPKSNNSSRSYDTNNRRSSGNNKGRSVKPRQ